MHRLLNHLLLLLTCPLLCEGDCAHGVIPFFDLPLIGDGGDGGVQDNVLTGDPLSRLESEGDPLLAALQNVAHGGRDLQAICEGGGQGLWELEADGSLGGVADLKADHSFGPDRHLAEVELVRRRRQHTSQTGSAVFARRWLRHILQVPSDLLDIAIALEADGGVLELVVECVDVQRHGEGAASVRMEAHLERVLRLGLQRHALGADNSEVRRGRGVDTRRGRDDTVVAQREIHRVRLAHLQLPELELAALVAEEGWSIEGDRGHGAVAAQFELQGIARRILPFRHHGLEGGAIGLQTRRPKAHLHVAVLVRRNVELLR
mmetsp:Transcript_108225/g.231065  ORF Transcript_108225/g.231065 Transcript_108225/m.231065 type:complete len:319 (+) Transcript_108225:2933-3889(+)